jgi:hypothetical protein
MKPLINLFLLFVTLSLFSQSKNGNISFTEYQHNFDYINEKDGKVEHTFHFVNKGKAPFTIIEVVSECGCTVPLYTEETVQPGDSGVVKAVFNPEDPIDKEFHKTLTVRVSNDTATIKIKGHIIPIERPKEEAMFTKRMGNTWFRSAYFQFGKMTSNQVFTKQFDYYNAGKDSITLNIDSLPDFLKIKIIPEVLAPKTVGTIEIEYDAIKRNDYGYLQDEFQFVSTEDTLATKNMFVSGNVAEYFSPDIDLEQAPKAVITSPATVELGTILFSTPKETIFTIKNEGKEVLIIRKITSSCTCIKAESLTGMEVKSGEEIQIKAVFDGQGRRKGNVSKSLYVYVNDPQNSILKFRLKGYLK